MKKSNREFWWEDMTGPQLLLQSVVETLRTRRIPLIFLPKDAPWKENLPHIIFRTLRTDLNLHNLLPQELNLENLDYHFQNEEDFQRFFLDNLATTNQRHQYIPRRSQIPHQHFMQFALQEELFTNKFLWIRGFSQENIKYWLTFLKDLPTYFNQQDNPHIILELPKIQTLPSCKTVVPLHYSDYITRYDLQLFCQSHLKDHRKYSNQWKHYVTALVSNVSDTNAILAIEILTKIDFLLQEPLAYIHYEDNNISILPQGEEITEPNPQLTQKVWKAQIEIIFPLLELLRCEYIKLLESQLEKIIENIPDYLFKTEEPIENAYQFELGHLYYLLTYQSNSFQLHDPALLEEISFIRSSRNDLAHRKCLSLSQLKKIFAYVRQRNLET